MSIDINLESHPLNEINRMLNVPKEWPRYDLEKVVNLAFPIGGDQIDDSIPKVQHTLILVRVHSCLKASNYASVRRLECQIENGTVVIRGCVSSYYIKQIAQEEVGRLGLAEIISNEVEVTNREYF